MRRDLGPGQDVNPAGFDSDAVASSASPMKEAPIASERAPGGAKLNIRDGAAALHGGLLGGGERRDGARTGAQDEEIACSRGHGRS